MTKMASSDTETATRIWVRLRALVLEQHDRRPEACAALGMSSIRIKALRRLAEGPLTMRELTAHLSTDPPYTTHVVDDLERRGFVRRAPHQDDRRCKVVTATPAGVAAAETAGRILAEPPAPMLELDPAELAELDRITARLIT